MQTFTSLEYLKIDVATNFGLDKESWDARIAWFEKNEGSLVQITSLSSAELKANYWMQAAEEPSMFFAGLCAYETALAGQPIGYAVSLDATASGAQLLSILIGCEKSARSCNVIDTGHREDLYTNVYNGMRKRLRETSGTVDRKDAKQAVMTSLYGSEATPKRVFGEGTQLICFYETMEQDVPGIWELNTDLLDLWRPDALSHDWVLPDNFHTKNKVTGKRVETVQFLNAPVDVITEVNEPQFKGRAMPANITHSIDGMVVRELIARCNFDRDHVLDLLEMIHKSDYVRSPHMVRTNDKKVKTLWAHYERTGFLSARIIDFLDRDNLAAVDPSVISKLLLSMPEQPFEVMSVHDCFRCHPNYGNDLRRQYNEILACLSESNLLADIASQILKTEITIQKRGLSADQIRDANYALS